MKNSDKQDDRYLFQKLINNSEGALEKIHHRYKGMMTRYIRFFIRNDDELIKEIISDVLLVVWQQREIVVHKQHPVRWMMHVAHNMAVSQFRKDGAHLTESLDNYINLPGNTYADSGLKTEELEVLLHEFVAELPAAEGDVFIRSKIEEMSNEEIAEQLGISRQTVKNELSRALIKLRKYLETLGYVLIYLIFNS